MEKLFVCIGIIAFIFVTGLVLTTDVGSFEHTLTISSQQLSMNAPNATIKTTDTNINNANANINNSTATISNKNIKTQNTELSPEFAPMKTSSVNYYESPTKFGTGSVKDYPQKVATKQTGLDPAKTKELEPKSKFNPKYKEKQKKDDEYVYKTLDWNTWRSDFINTITDDSLSIRELDDYPQGTMFHYSFTVDNTGRIYNIRVTSLQLSKEDREKVVKLIKSYEYTAITNFPRGSNRKTADVKAILLLSNKTEYSRPSDFHDLEPVKLLKRF